MIAHPVQHWICDAKHSEMSPMSAWDPWDLSKQAKIAWLSQEVNTITLGFGVEMKHYENFVSLFIVTKMIVVWSKSTHTHTHISKTKKQQIKLAAPCTFAVRLCWKLFSFAASSLIPVALHQNASLLFPLHPVEPVCISFC